MQSPRAMHDLGSAALQFAGVLGAQWTSSEAPRHMEPSPRPPQPALSKWKVKAEFDSEASLKACSDSKPTRARHRMDVPVFVAQVATENAQPETSRCQLPRARSELGSPAPRGIQDVIIVGLRYVGTDSASFLVRTG
jgi:hypothetical protein